MPKKHKMSADDADSLDAVLNKYTKKSTRTEYLGEEDDSGDTGSAGDSDDVDDMHGVIFAALKKIPFKLLAFIFVIYILLTSEVFMNKILSKFNGAVGYGTAATTYGCMITGILLVIAISPIYLLIQNKII